MSDEIVNLINQAKDQARKEGLKNFFGKHAKLISRLAIVGVFVAVLALIYSSVQNSQQAKYSAIFHQSLIYQQLGDETQAKAELQKIYDAKMAPANIKSLASLRLAAVYFNEGNLPEAEKIYSEVSKCGSCDIYIKDLAGLLLVKSWMSSEAAINQDDILSRVEKAENANEIFKYQISEQRAFLEALKGNLEKSYQILELIQKSPESSDALKERAKNGIQILFSKGFEPKIAPVK